MTDTIIPNCPGCAFLRDQIDILISTRGQMIEANFAMAARVAALEREIGRRAEADRQTADLLSGLADLQRVEAGE